MKLKGVIRNPAFKGTTEEEITEGIDGVIHSRIRVKGAGSCHETNSILLTFESCELPSQVKAGYLKLDVQTYYILKRWYKQEK